MTPRNWTLAGFIVGTVAFVWLFEKEREAKAASGDLPIPIEPGLMTNLKAPSRFIAVLQLPPGGHWVRGVDTTAQSPPAMPSAIALPKDLAGPWGVPVLPGSTVAVQWTDAVGIAQTTFLGFV